MPGGKDTTLFWKRACGRNEEAFREAFSLKKARLPKNTRHGGEKILCTEEQ
jgi:hypothetical protein